jgi:glucose-1-phosphate cytidylyltransferase
MKVVILAGGLGTRLTEETTTRPKPMVEVGDKPLLWHIMKIFSSYGHNDFVICTGYKGYQIKEYFHNYWLHNCDVTFDMATHDIEVLQDANEPWHVTVIDTGQDTMTGGRVKRIREQIGSDTFMMTYGDGVADVDIRELVEFHRSHGKAATVTAVQPAGRFGAMDLTGECAVLDFREKPVGDGGWVSGGFFVLEPVVLDYIEGDSTIWEREPLESLSRDCQLMAFKHEGFWHPMDTLRDKNYLESLWESGRAPWKTW